MQSHPPDYRSEGQYAAFQTDPTNLSLLYPASAEYQAFAWPLRSSTASFATSPLPPLPVALPSIDQSSASSLAATFGGYPFSHLAPTGTFANNDLFPSMATARRQPRQSHHFVEAPNPTVAPQLTWVIPPTSTGYTPPAPPQPNHAYPPRHAKRHREEAEGSGQGLHATIRRPKHRAVNVESRLHKGLADIVESQSSRHVVEKVVPQHQPRQRGATPPARGVENIPVLEDSRDSYAHVQGHLAETRSRGRALALEDYPGILNATSSGANASNSIPSIGTSAAADPVFSNDSAWYTPAFYEELRDIASSFVAQSQARMSGPSGAIPQCVPRVDEVLPDCLVSQAPSSLGSYHSGSTEEPQSSAGQAPTRRHLDIESSGSPSGVLKPEGIYLCPFADSSGVCRAPNPSKKRSSKGRKTKYSHSRKGARNSRLTFSRPADVDRHVLSVHMKVYVHCKRHHEGGRVPCFVRFDGFQRHLRNTCIKKGERAELVNEVMAQLRVTDPKDPRIDRNICRRFAFVPMPCYQSDVFKTGLSVLRVPKTALSLESEWRTNVNDIRLCKCCENVANKEMDAIPSSNMGCVRSQSGSAYCDVLEALDHDDNRLLPEEEGGVDGEPISDSVGHASNVEAEPVCSTMHLVSEMHRMVQEFPAVDFYDLEEQESHESSSRGEALADHCDGTFQTTDSENDIDQSARDPHDMESQPWYIDFGAEALDPNATAWLRVGSITS